MSIDDENMNSSQSTGNASGSNQGGQRPVRPGGQGIPPKMPPTMMRRPGMPPIPGGQAGKPKGAEGSQNKGTNPESKSSGPNSIMSSLQFPTTEKVSAVFPTDKPPVPSGPSPDVVARIQTSKMTLREQNRRLDQTVGAQMSRQSPSKYARKDIDLTMSDKTAGQYLARGRLLVNRYKREQDIPMEYDEFNPVEFVTWLLSLKPTVKSSSWRVYRQAAYYMIMGLPDPDIDRALSILDNDVIENDDKAGRPKTTKSGRADLRRTSSMKEKRFPKKDFDKTVAYLKNVSKSKMAPLLVDWMIATIHTGLRPIEWRATSIEQFEDSRGRSWTWLYVLNAKTTNERGNGLVRTLDLSSLPDEVIECIKRMSERGLRWLEDGRYDTMKSQIGQLLYTVAEKIFSGKIKHYALYSCRHQFIANMKSLMSPEEVSALSGHAVTKTAISSYGKKSSSWGPEEIGAHARPISEEVATVRQTAKFFRDRIEKLKEAGMLKDSESSDFPV